MSAIDQWLHRRIDAATPFTLRWSVFRWLHWATHEAAYLLAGRAPR
jgi:hypothetical protein